MMTGSNGVGNSGHGKGSQGAKVKLVTKVKIVGVTSGVKDWFQLVEMVLSNWGNKVKLVTKVKLVM